jgi:hypothetical protein
MCAIITAFLLFYSAGTLLADANKATREAGECFHDRNFYDASIEVLMATLNSAAVIACFYAGAQYLQ